jgi:hypothetical protein
MCELPLTVADAVHAVNVLSKKLNTIVEIEIRLMPKYKNKWHYLIKTANSKPCVRLRLITLG